MSLLYHVTSIYSSPYSYGCGGGGLRMRGSGGGELRGWGREVGGRRDADSHNRDSGCGEVTIYTINVYCILNLCDNQTSVMLFSSKLESPCETNI